jgi:hypothetical protein
MASFAVTLTKTHFLTVIIEASSEEDAGDIAVQQFMDGEYEKAPWIENVENEDALITSIEPAD